MINCFECTKYLDMYIQKTIVARSFKYFVDCEDNLENQIKYDCINKTKTKSFNSKIIKFICHNNGGENWSYWECELYCNILINMLACRVFFLLSSMKIE